MDTLKSYLPKQTGILPYWLLILSIISIGNSVQTYTTTYYTKRIYCGPRAAPNASPTKQSQLTNGFDLTRSPANELSTRTFGTWTFLTSIVRLYAAYNIDNSVAYQLAIWTYVVAFMHFMSEWFYFGTTRWGKPLAGPAIISTVGLLWMLVVWGNYVN